MGFHSARQVEALNQSLADLGNNISVSFEFFPPNSEGMENTLWQSIERLQVLEPKFVSVTYGANSGTRDRTHKVIKDIKERTGLIAAPHLTCIDASRDELRTIARDYWNSGIRHIVALRGDLPPGLDKPDMYATDLVALLKSEADFDISVAAYPEGHPEARSAQSDLLNLKRKIDAGANRAITQFFFDARHYFDLVESLHALGVDKPVIAGIMPATSMRSITRMSELQGSEFPRELAAKLEAAEPDGPEAVHRVGVEEATRLCRELLDRGAPGLHFFTLNRSMATREIYEALGL